MQYQKSNLGDVEKSLQVLERIRDELKGATIDPPKEEGQGKDAARASGNEKSATEAKDDAASAQPKNDDNVDIASSLNALQGEESEAKSIPKSTGEDEKIAEALSPQEAVSSSPQEAVSSSPQEEALSPQEEAASSPQEAASAKPNAHKANAVKWPIKLEFEDDDDEEDEPLQAIFDAKTSLAQNEESDALPFAEEEALSTSNVALEISKNSILELLEYLKSALAFLPQEDQDKYRKSSERLRLERLIARLSGKPGLLRKSMAKSARGASLQE